MQKLKLIELLGISEHDWLNTDKCICQRQGTVVDRRGFVKNEICDAWWAETTDRPYL